jgi:hypothetical protein
VLPAELTETPRGAAFGSEPKQRSPQPPCKPPKALEISARIVEAARSALSAGAAGARLGALDDGSARPGPITASFIPSHLDHALKAQQQQQQQAAGQRPEPQRITRCAHAAPSCEFAEEVEVSELRAVAGR